MNKKIGVVYFSKDGSTKKLADMLGVKYSAEVIELVEKSSKGNLFTRGYRSITKKGSELIGNPSNRVKDFDELYLCTPIWASNGTPAMNTFISDSDFEDKTISIITVRAGTKPLKGTFEYLTKKVEEQNGKVKSCYNLHGAMIGKTATEESLQKQIEDLNL